MRARLYMNFGWMAQDGYYYGPNGIVGLYHKGRDFVPITGTDLYIGDSKIGKIGATGMTSGVHVHVQAGRDFYAQTPIDPEPHEFEPGTVVQVGWGDAWGNYVIMRNISGIYVVYAHFERVDVVPGQKVGSMATTLTDALIDKEYIANRGTPATADEKKQWRGRALDELSFAFKAGNDARREALRAANAEKDRIIAKLSERPSLGELQEVRLKYQEAEERLAEALKKADEEESVEGLLTKLLKWIKSKWSE